jgi:hypothetical protein
LIITAIAVGVIVFAAVVITIVARQSKSSTSSNGGGSSASDGSPGPGTAPRLHVSGNKIVTAAGATYRLLGVNRSGGEFSCVESKGIWDGPVDEASIKAIASWHANSVRIALNEDCWLGLGNLPAASSGDAYRTAVETYVARLEAHGITPMLELHWSEGTWTGKETHCSSEQALCQKPMPDAAHSYDFWSGVANVFKNDQAVVFDLFNEAYPSSLGIMSTTQAWQCWRDGGDNCVDLTYQAVGMQNLLDTVRGTGAKNLVLIGGNGYAADLTQWLNYAPTDPTGNVAAAWHNYDYSTCVKESCWQRQVAPVAAQVPVVATEIGETDCATSYVTPLMDWLDSASISYLGWTWNTWDCSTGPALISNYDGTPTTFGKALKDRLASQAGN